MRWRVTNSNLFFRRCEKKRGVLVGWSKANFCSCLPALAGREFELRELGAPERLVRVEDSSGKSFEHCLTTAVYPPWLRRFGRWHVLAFEGFSACPARIFFSHLLRGILPRIVNPCVSRRKTSS